MFNRLCQYTILERPRRSRPGLFLLLGLSLFLLPIGSQAEEHKEEAGPPGYVRAEEDPGQDEMQQSVIRIQTRVRQLQDEIAQIRDQALNNNPELENILRDLVLTRNEVMTRHLAREDVNQEEIQKITAQLQDSEISAQKREELEKKKKEAFLGYKKAEMRTQQNGTVQEMRNKFYSQLLESAEKENPKIKDKLEELHRLQSQLRFAKQEALAE
ncbi:MAG: hypothetical protein U5L00_02085 [Desulfovermiculus sp.]|nr:hypothetical protein [Desulfovermiculus sp.]